jgi:rhodanese-related sulfurtransferase
VLARLMGLRTVSPRDLRREIESGATAVIDVNGPGSWERAHVPGARHLDAAAFGPSDLPEERSAALVFYCSNPLCRKAPNAARRARGFGWENVRVMSAGIQGWISAGLPVESAPRQ